MKILKVFLFFLIYIHLSGKDASDNSLPEIIYTGKNILDINSRTQYLITPDKNLTIADVTKLDFQESTKNQINFGNVDGALWMRFRIVNQSERDTLMLRIANSILQKSRIYILSDRDTTEREIHSGVSARYRDIWSADHVYKLIFMDTKVLEVYLSVENQEQMLVPLKLEAPELNSSLERLYLLVSGLYVGLIGSMFLYNLFLFVTIRDKSYLWYVIHTLFVGIAQSSFNGLHLFYFAFSPYLIEITPTVFSALASITGIQFMITFLNVKSFNNNYYFILKIFLTQYILVILIAVLSSVKIGYQILLPTQGLVAVTILYISIRMAISGNRSAKFYLLAWSIFMVGIFVFAMKDFGILPYNNFTKYTMFIGSGIEVLLLSFALAEKIKVLQREKEFSQLQALLKAEENEKLIREQNILLEQKVQERTEELVNTNQKLQKTLQDLKDAQSQLVDKEKMASLGQLTAGIAHEINNPINFITSGIHPLKHDIKDLVSVLNEYEKTFGSHPDAKPILDLKKNIDFEYLIKEIEDLLNGIAEGARRTADIVVGLRTFSRLDEDVLKYTNINNDIDATLILLSNKLKNTIKVKKNYCADAEIECYPGKMNQVFMNILSNAIDAINAKSFETNETGQITITTSHNDEYFEIEISDNGIGMSDEIKKKIFDPFFTTKKVGEGTGLGMAIVYKIIEKHKGKIIVHSEEGKGTTFKIFIHKNINEIPENYLA